MKIINNGPVLLIDGKGYGELSENEKKNLYLRCVDYMRTHYDEPCCRVTASLVTSYLGEFDKDKGFVIDI